MFDSVRQAISLRHLESFSAVMATGTVSGAARRLHVSQPAISQKIAQVEAILNLKLFARERKRLCPTPAAVALHEEVLQAFQQLGRVLNLATELRTDMKEHLRLAAPHGLCHSIVPNAVAAFSVLRPRLQCDVQLGTYDEILRLVAAGEVDVGIVKLPIQHAEVTVTPLCRSETVCLMPEAHPLVAKPRIAPRDLDGHPLVMLGRKTVARGLLEQQLREVGVVPTIQIETKSVAAACGFARAGLGIAVVNALMASQHLADGLVCRAAR